MDKEAIEEDSINFIQLLQTGNIESGSIFLLFHISKDEQANMLDHSKSEMDINNHLFQFLYVKNKVRKFK